MKKLRKINIINTVIKLFFFFMLPAAWATGFAGIKYLCTQIHSGRPIELTSFLAAFAALALFTIVFGRFFCGRACAFGTYGDILHEAAKLIAAKLHIQMPGIPARTGAVLRYAKYGVLVSVLGLCILGYGSEVSGASPWTAFSHIRVGEFSFSSIPEIAGLVLFVMCSVGMMFAERFFCRFLCPFGAVFSLLPILPFSVLSRDRNKCLSGCSACARICPACLSLPHSRQLSIRDETCGPDEGVNGVRFSVKEYRSEERRNAIIMGECFQCGKCVHLCPKRNACSFVLRSGTAGIAADIVKAGILAAILYKVI